MTLEENKAIVRRWFKVWEDKDVDLIDELHGPDYDEVIEGMDKREITLLLEGQTGVEQAPLRLDDLAAVAPRSPLERVHQVRRPLSVASCR